MVQDIANDLETDEINSINDTVESIQIAQIVRTTYEEMLANRNWPHLKRTLQLESSLDLSMPTHMKAPDEVKELIKVNYNKRRASDTKDRYEAVSWLEPEEFLIKTNRRNSSDDNILKVLDFGGAELLIKTDKAPQWMTSFDDEWLVFDSYDVGVDSTLQNSKTQTLCYVTPEWTHSDSFIPDLPMEAFPALLAEAKSTAFVVLKQQANEKAEQKAQRQHSWLSRKAWKVAGGVRYPNYGRSSNTTGSYGRSTQIDKG